MNDKNDVVNEQSNPSLLNENNGDIPENNNVNINDVSDNNQKKVPRKEVRKSTQKPSSTVNIDDSANNVVYVNEKEQQKRRICPKTNRFGARAQTLLVEEGWKFSSIVLSNQVTKLPNLEKIQITTSFPTIKKKKEKKSSNMTNNGGELDDEIAEVQDEIKLSELFSIDNPTVTCKFQNEHLSVFFDNQKKVMFDFHSAKLKKQLGFEGLNAGFVCSNISKERHLFVHSMYKPSKCSSIFADFSYHPLFHNLKKFNLAFNYVNEYCNLNYFAKSDENLHFGTQMSVPLTWLERWTSWNIFAGIIALKNINLFESTHPHHPLPPLPPQSSSSSPSPPISLLSSSDHQFGSEVGRRKSKEKKKSSSSSSLVITQPIDSSLPTSPSPFSSSSSFSASSSSSPSLATVDQQFTNNNNNINRMKVNLSLLFSHPDNSSSLTLFVDNVLNKQSSSIGAWLHHSLNNKTDVALKVVKKDQWNVMAGISHQCDKDTFMKLRISNSLSFAAFWSKKYVKEKFRIQIAVESNLMNFYYPFFHSSSPSSSAVSVTIPSSPSSSSTASTHTPHYSSPSFLSLPKIGIQFRWG